MKIKKKIKTYPIKVRKEEKAQNELEIPSEQSSYSLLESDHSSDSQGKLSNLNNKQQLPNSDFMGQKCLQDIQ